MVDGATFLNCLFHSCSATRTFTARDIFPADTTTPMRWLDMKFCTMGVAAFAVDAMVGVY